MIYVTHDQVEAMTMADKIVVMNKGNIEQVGKPLDLYHRPKNTFVASFIGSPAMNFLEGRVSSQNGQGVEVALDDGGNAFVPCKHQANLVGQVVTLGIRPEELRIGGAGGSAISGKIFNVERLGGDTFLYVKQRNGNDLTVHAAGDAAARLGEEVSFAFDNTKCHLFTESGEAVERLPS